MELKYLLTFRKIIDTGSYQQAAKELNYAPSTLTFQIHQLEQEFGVQLFEGKNGSKTLTPAGRELLPFIDQVLDSAAALTTYCRQRDQLQGILTIAAPESLITYQLPPVLKAFREKAPHVELRLQCLNCFEIFRRLCSGSREIDIALHYDVGNYPKSIEVMPLCEFPLVLVGAPALSADERDFITPGRKKYLCHIQNDPDALSLVMFQEYLEKKKIQLDTPFEVGSIETIKHCTENGLGVSFLPYFTVKEELERGSLVSLPLDLVKPHMTAIAARQKDRWKSPASELFLNLLKNTMGEIAGG